MKQIFLILFFLSSIGCYSQCIKGICLGEKYFGYKSIITSIAKNGGSLEITTLKDGTVAEISFHSCSYQFTTETDIEKYPPEIFCQKYRSKEDYYNFCSAVINQFNLKCPNPSSGKSGYSDSMKASISPTVTVFTYYDSGYGETSYINFFLKDEKLMEQLKKEKQADIQSDF